jgi:sugar phosphate isomerase/epimerase
VAVLLSAFCCQPSAFWEFEMEIWPIGVFTSIDAGLGVKLEVASELRIPTIQLHAPQESTRTADNARKFIYRLNETDLALTAVFGGFEGESYADIPTVERTVGLVPRETRAARMKEMKEIANFARRLGCSVVALHLGFVPHDSADPLFEEVVHVARELCDHCRGISQSVHLETGQEPADALLNFLKAVERNNLFINFDPANMILYGCGEPIAALKLLGKYVRSVHCKDAKWAANPGKEWGRETALGEGDVGIENYLRTLKEIGYTGPLTIEREIPQEPERQKVEIGHAVKLLTELKKKILG